MIIERAKTNTADIDNASDESDSLTRAIAHLAAVQLPNGAWEAEMVWNSMLLSQWVMVQHIVGKLPTIDARTRARILHQYDVTQTPEGGWAMHGEGAPYVFMTTLAYVALRLLGVPADEAARLTALPLPDTGTW